VEVELHEFLTLALDGGEWPVLHPGHFTPGVKTPITHWIGGWVGPKAGLHMVAKEKIPSLLVLGIEPLSASHNITTKMLYLLQL
jgi:hypothetical protein